MSSMLEQVERFVYLIRNYSWMADPRMLGHHAAVRIDRPIFLLGTQGGGLTLLSRMLRRHPDVVSAAGNSHYWTSSDEIQNVYGPLLPPELTGLRHKAPDHPVLTAPRSWTFAARDLFQRYRETEDDVTPEISQALQRVIRYSIRRFSGSPQRARFLDKSQSYSVRASLIWAILAESEPRFILVPRDPYVSVYRAAHGKAADMRRLKDRLSYADRLDICAEHYANTMRSTLHDADRLQFPLKIVRFEELVQNPEDILRECCRFTELEFRATMLPGSDDRFPLGSRFRDRWYPVRTTVNEPYERRLDQLTIDSVNRHCAGLFASLGYRARSSPALK